MWPRWSYRLLLATLSTSLVGAQPATPVSSGAPQPTRPACGTIINDPNGTNLSEVSGVDIANIQLGAMIFDAGLVYECLTSVPFNPAVATRFLQYYNDTISFHTTIEYLKNPPPTYQQPRVDLVAGIQQLQGAINSGSFANQYEFEAALQLLLINAHDDHLSLNAGILSAFTFASPFDIVSLSVDGVEAPRVYIAGDVFQSDSFTLFQPSPIQSINGQDVTTYLESFASGNVAGSLEPHTDWNRLMFSFAQDIQGSFNVFSGQTPFFPGETITFEFDNGTSRTESNLGIYSDPGPTGPLETGGDFYNFFVLGRLPASFDASLGLEDPSNVGTPTPEAPLPDAAPSSPPLPPSWNSPAYPETPDVAQPDLGILGGGLLSGGEMLYTLSKKILF